MLTTVLTLRRRVLERMKKVAWIGPTLVRLTLGIVFMGTGWGKLHGLDDVTKFFTDLHLPAPHFQAILVASTEFFGGLAILLGLATRLAALPLAITMVVAILTAKRAQIDGVSALVGLEEWSYLVMFLWLVFAGPGPLSLDRLLVRSLRGNGRPLDGEPATV